MSAVSALHEAAETLRPADEAELAAIIAGAQAPLRVVGGDTRAMAGPGQRVSTRAISGIVDYVPAALTLIARAGTPLADIESLVAGEGQQLAFEPPDWRRALGTGGTPTIGSVVAANLSGPRAVAGATPRDHLLGLRFVDGHGAAIKSGGRVMKNVTGYDLARLVCGARGRLGAISEVALKVLPAPETRATLVLDGQNDATAIAAMSAALSTPWEVNGAARTPDGRVCLRLEGFAQSVAYRRDALAGHLAHFGAWRLAEDDPWPAIRDLEGLGAGDYWLVRCRPSQAADLLAKAGANKSLVDLGGARLVLALTPGADLREIVPGMRVVRLGRPDAFVSDPAIAKLNDALAARFDPHGLFRD